MTFYEEESAKHKLNFDKIANEKVVNRLHKMNKPNPFPAALDT